MTVARATQTTVRVVSDGVPKARVSQITARVVSSATNNARITQVTARVVSTNTADNASGRPIVFMAT